MSAQQKNAPRIIYDIGSNNGDDIPYYLFKADRVIAVEANPSLCDLIKARFAAEIANGRLIVENSAITDGNEESVEFYIHKQHHVLSSLIVGHDKKDDYIATRVNAVNIATLVKKYGAPYYAKIDIEGYDENILESFAENRIKPDYISAESHKIGVFALLSERLGYQSFKLIEGSSVSSVYKQAVIWSPILNVNVIHSFPSHAAGPFGNDIHGEWMSKSSLLKVLAIQGLGWKDIHASSVDAPTLKF